MPTSTYQLGPIACSFSGHDDPVFEAVCDEISVLDEASTKQPDVRFRFVDELQRPEQMLHAGRWSLSDGVVAGEGHGYDFCMRSSDGTFDVEVCASPNRRSVTDHFERAWDWNFLAPHEETAKNFMYNLFDVVTTAALLRRDASYLHASSFCRDGAGVALIAWGGIGKTSSVLKLVTEDGWRFLSDDLGLVDADSTLWRTPRRLQVYAYNVDGQRDVRRRLMEGRGPVDRINWHWRLARFGPKKVRRRIGAEELFGDDFVGDSARLDRAIFLERRDVSEFQFDPIDTDVLARRAATILIDELDTLFSLAVVCESHGIDVGIGTLEELRRRSTQTLKQSFKNLPGGRLSIPVDAGPDALADALRHRICG